MNKLIFILPLLITAREPHPADIEVANKKLQTKIHFQCDKNEFDDLNCRVEKTQYIRSDSQCVAQITYTKSNFIRVAPKMWVDSRTLSHTAPCLVLRREVIVETNKGWKYEVEDNLITEETKNSKYCQEYKRKETYHEDENLTDILCE